MAMEMEKKNNKGLIAFVIILIICIIGLVIYILVNKDVINLNSHKVENGQIEENATSDNSENTTTGVALDVDNASIKNLFDNAHYFTITGVDAHIYQNGGYTVSEMSNEEKMRLLAKQWSPLVEEYSKGTDQTITYYITEDTLKNIYERTFGPNTYSKVSQITDGCLTLTYDTAAKRYSYTGTSGCGGTSAFSAYENIIKATKYSDRIEIVSAVFYESPEGIYKDYKQTTVLGENTFYSNDYTEEARDNLRKQYLESNKDNLEQYTYLYTLNDDGFYYLTSVKRAKA